MLKNESEDDFYPHKCKSVMSSGKDRPVLANSFQYSFTIHRVYFSPWKCLFLHVHLLINICVILCVPFPIVGMLWIQFFRQLLFDKEFEIALIMGNCVPTCSCRNISSASKIKIVVSVCGLPRSCPSHCITISILYPGMSLP